MAQQPRNGVGLLLPYWSDGGIGGNTGMLAWEWRENDAGMAVLDQESLAVEGDRLE